LHCAERAHRGVSFFLVSDLPECFSDRIAAVRAPLPASVPEHPRKLKFAAAAERVFEDAPDSAMCFNPSAPF
jgi:hypothetical protein